MEKSRMDGKILLLKAPSEKASNSAIANEIRNKLEESYAPGYFPHFEHR